MPLKGYRMVRGHIVDLIPMMIFRGYCLNGLSPIRLQKGQIIMPPVRIDNPKSNTPGIKPMHRYGDRSLGLRFHKNHKQCPPQIRHLLHHPAGDARQRLRLKYLNPLLQTWSKGSNNPYWPSSLPQKHCVPSSPNGWIANKIDDCKHR
jgi:hypothetical protein